MRGACIPTHTCIRNFPFWEVLNRNMESDFLKVLCIYIRGVGVKSLYQVKLICLNLY